MRRGSRMEQISKRSPGPFLPAFHHSMVKVFFPSAAEAGSPDRKSAAAPAAEPASNSRREKAMAVNTSAPRNAADYRSSNRAKLPAQSTCQLSVGEEVDWTGDKWPNGFGAAISEYQPHGTKLRKGCDRLCEPSRFRTSKQRQFLSRAFITRTKGWKYRRAGYGR
jgi:hypothetical protein